ncbi:MAG: ATP synthase F1 subunit delta [Pyrinomonadaceae bacterium]
MSIETIARRYGTALADVVLKSGETDTVKEELKAFGSMIDGNADLESVFSNPAIAHASKENLLGELIKKTKPAKTTANFLRVLLQNSRLTELGEISERFESVLAERSGVVSAEIVSARELPATARKEFEKNLASLTGKTVRVNYAVDANIIGGVVTRIGSTVYDGSVRTKLENLREQLVNG